MNLADSNHLKLNPKCDENCQKVYWCFNLQLMLVDHWFLFIVCLSILVLFSVFLFFLRARNMMVHIILLFGFLFLGSIETHLKFLLKIFLNFVYFSNYFDMDCCYEKLIEILFLFLTSLFYYQTILWIFYLISF